MPDQFSDHHLSVISADEALAKPNALLIDVRKSAARAASGRDIAGSTWHDPYALDHTSPLTRADHPLVVFCVHGHEVSQFACALLKLHMREVAYVRGGFEALVAAGAATVSWGEEEIQ